MWTTFHGLCSTIISTLPLGVGFHVDIISSHFDKCFCIFSIARFHGKTSVDMIKTCRSVRRKVDLESIFLLCGFRVTDICFGLRASNEV